MSDGYMETIEKGISFVRNMRRDIKIFPHDSDTNEKINILAEKIRQSDAVIIGAGAGLSTAAGFTYSGERFLRYFYDFAEKYGIQDMYSGGFYPFPKEEIMWAWWSRHIYFNRYVPASRPTYRELLDIVRDKDYFVITTNVDHQFQAAGFDKKRLFYTQGDYGLWQSSSPGAARTYDNREQVMAMLESQGFVKNQDGIYEVPPDKNLKMEIPSSLIPVCPNDGGKMTMNLRSDDNFAEDEGWHRASSAYSTFLNLHKGMKTLYLELGVGANTPMIIKYPFWQMVSENEKSFYACVNMREAFCPSEIEQRSLCINADISETIGTILKINQADRK